MGIKLGKTQKEKMYVSVHSLLKKGNFAIHLVNNVILDSEDRTFSSKLDCLVALARQVAQENRKTHTCVPLGKRCTN